MFMPIAQSKMKPADKLPVRPACIKRFTRVLGGILFCNLLHHPVQAQGGTVPAGQSVTLAWSPSFATNATGYNIYYGVTSHAYTNMVHVSNVTHTTIPGLVAGTTYYFAATTYDSLGTQSGYSNEASYAVPAALTQLQIRAAPGRQFTFMVTGPSGRTNQILATEDFKTWILIGSVTIGAGGSQDFTDTNAASYSKRFYRTQEIP